MFTKKSKDKFGTPSPKRFSLGKKQEKTPTSREAVRRVTSSPISKGRSPSRPALAAGSTRPLLVWHVWERSLGLQIVTLDQGEFSGRRELRVNGALIYEKKSTMWDVGSKHKFGVQRNSASHSFELEILRSIF